MSTTPRRGRAMPTDGPTAKFLYTIIKQLDLKSIDWNLVASQLEISNGHAARMRYSRFRQQMEGITSTPRASRAKKPPNKSKAGSSKADILAEEAKAEANVVQPKAEVKHEPGPMHYRQSSPFIKADPYRQRIPSLADVPQATRQTLSDPSLRMSSIPYSPVTTATYDPRMCAPASRFPRSSSLGYEQHPRPRHIWTPIKAEPDEHGGVDDVLVRVEQTEELEVVSPREEVECQGTTVAGMGGGHLETQK